MAASLQAGSHSQPSCQCQQQLDGATADARDYRIPLTRDLGQAAHPPLSALCAEDVQALWVHAAHGLVVSVCLRRILAWHFLFGTRPAPLRPRGSLLTVSGQKHQRFIEDDAQKIIFMFLQTKTYGSSGKVRNVPISTRWRIVNSQKWALP